MAFDTSILDAALARRRAGYERERQALLAQVMRLLEQLAPDYDIQQAYVFGSLAVPAQFGPHSDVDLAVEQIAPEQFFEAISKFSTALGRDVDLVELSQCHFAYRIREKLMPLAGIPGYCIV